MKKKLRIKRNPIQLDFKPEKLEDLSKVFGSHWRKLWDRIKLETQSKIRKPYYIQIQDYPFENILNDYDSCLRFAFDIETGQVSEGLEIVTHTAAYYQGTNNDKKIIDLPKNVLIVDVKWSDYTKYMGFKVQAPVGMLPNQIMK